MLERAREKTHTTAAKRGIVASTPPRNTSEMTMGGLLGSERKMW
jgi:hypothetical protein